MKKWLVFVLGMITGVILTFAFLVFLGIIAQMNENSKYTLFDQPREIVDSDAFKVFQVLEDHSALVESNTEGSDHLFIGPTFLLTNDEGKYYYDEEIIRVSKGKVARQIGIFHYNTKLGEKTVPIIKIMNAQNNRKSYFKK